MKKFSAGGKVTAVTALLTVLSLSFLSCSNFKPFDRKDTGPKIYLMTGVNQFENGDFSMGDTHWGTYFQQGGSCEVNYSGNQAKIEIKRTGGAEYGVQFFYDGIRLYHDGQYTFAFTASSSAPKGCEARIQLNGGDYHAYAIDVVQFTPEEKRYEINFTMTEDSDVAPRVAFNLGKIPEYDQNDGKCTVIIKDVSLVLNNTIAEAEKGNGGADVVRVNQVGFAPDEKKIAYVKVQKNGLKFQLLDQNKNVVYEGKLGKAVRDEMAWEYVAPADFSQFNEPGTYTVRVGDSESFPFKITPSPYKDLMADLLRYYYLARCGTEVKDDVFGHPACHTQPSANMSRTYEKDTLGGWHDAGDYGRYVVPAAKAVVDLLLSSSGYENSGSVMKLLDEVMYELEWMLKMQKEDGTVIHKVTCSKFPPFQMPEEEQKNLYLSETTRTATADFAGALAFASLFYESDDNDIKQVMLDAAVKAWNSMQNGGIPFKKFKNAASIDTGEYTDDSSIDEEYFAAAALAVSCKNKEYGKAAWTLRQQAPSDPEHAWQEQFGWEQMEGYGDFFIIMNPEYFPEELVAQVKKAVIDAAKKYQANAKKSGFRQAQAKVGWGSNMEAMNITILLYLAAQIEKNPAYLELAKNQVDYVLGANPMSRCYVTGYGSNPPQHPHHRPSIAKNQPQPGMLVGGPDQELEDEFAVNLVSDKPPLQCYVDNYQSFSTNEVTIYWNSPLFLALNLLYK